MVWRKEYKMMTTAMPRFAFMALQKRNALATCLLAGFLSSQGIVAHGADKRMLNEQRTGLETIQVSLDNAKLLKLPSGTETIVVGNPAIADVVVQKNGIMVLTGRSIGSTNFIALDGSGTIISESIVSVAPNSLPGRLLVQRGVDRESYECMPNCLPTVSLGDTNTHFAGAISQTTQRDGFAGQAGGAAAGAVKK
jgi:hypothetical protein